MPSPAACFCRPLALVADRYGGPSRRLVAAGFSTMTTSQIMPWAFPRKVYRGERLANHDYRSMRRVLEQIAVLPNGARARSRRAYANGSAPCSSQRSPSLAVVGVVFLVAIEELQRRLRSWLSAYTIARPRWVRRATIVGPWRTAVARARAQAGQRITISGERLVRSLPGRL